MSALPRSVGRVCVLCESLHRRSSGDVNVLWMPSSVFLAIGYLHGSKGDELRTNVPMPVRL